ncbi:MAG: hypothetical protein Q9164_005532 [Protoblastenia rupestris]
MRDIALVEAAALGAVIINDLSRLRKAEVNDVISGISSTSRGNEATVSFGVVDEERVHPEVKATSSTTDLEQNIESNVKKLIEVFNQSLNVTHAAIDVYNRRKDKFASRYQKSVADNKELKVLKHAVVIHESHFGSMVKQMEPLFGRDVLGTSHTSSGTNIPWNIKEPCQLYYLFREKVQLQQMKKKADRISRGLLKFGESVPADCASTDKSILVAMHEVKRHHKVQEQCINFLTDLEAFEEQSGEVSEVLIPCLIRLADTLAENISPFERSSVGGALMKLEYTNHVAVHKSYTADPESSLELNLTEGEIVYVAKWNGDSRAGERGWYDVQRANGEEGIAPAKCLSLR